jgi:CheY-like chemotaxis protein
MKRVLIVDDALDLGRMLRAALETLDAGLYVRVLPSAEEALLEISRTPAALMVTDIRLPGMSGLELLKKVRKRSPETRFILITGLTDEGVLQQAEQAGAERFLRKPIHVAEFLEIAAELLELPPTPPTDPLDPKAVLPIQEDLSGLLSGLRRELGAQLVLLSNERGKVLAQAGEMPGLDFETQWAPDLMASLSSIARVSRLVHAGLPQVALAVRGDSVHLILAPVGDYALVVVQKGDASGLRTALAFESVLHTQKELARILKDMAVGFYTRSEAPEPALPDLPPDNEPVGVEEVIPASEAPPLEDLVSLLEGTSLTFDSANLEEYWESAAGTENVIPEDPDVLSYDQARQLGLTPENDE